MGWGINVGVLVFAIIVARGIASLLRARAREGRDRYPEGYDPALARTVEELQARVGELEERLDFAERMLATQRDAERLGPGKP